MCHIKYSLVIVLCYFENYTFADTKCSDWQTYKDEKCIKVFDALLSYDEAVNKCSQYNSTIITISSSEEQHFIENYLFAKLEIVDNVWTGLKYIDSKYKWVNSLNANYSNWSEESPKNRSDLCVQISSDILIGKWSDISCARKNFALCQYMATLTRQEFFNVLLNARKELENNKAQQKASIQSFDNTNKQLENAVNFLSFALIESNNRLDFASLISIISAEYHLNLTLNEWILTLASLENRTIQIENTIRQLSSKLENKSKELQNSLNGSLIKFFTENNVRKVLIIPDNFTRENYSRTEALEMCHKINATLVDIESLEKQKIVESFLRQNTLKYFWLGAYSDSSTGKFKWLNSGNELQYMNWRSNSSFDSGDVYIHIHNYDTDVTYIGKWFGSTEKDTNSVFCEFSIS